MKRRNGELVVREDTDEVIQDSTCRYRRLLLIIDGCVVDAGRFLPDHVSPSVEIRRTDARSPVGNP